MNKYLIITAVSLLIVGMLSVSAYRMRGRLGILGEFIQFLIERKLWWLAPMLILFAVAGLLALVVGHSGVLAMIYPLI